MLSEVFLVKNTSEGVAKPCLSLRCDTWSTERVGRVEKRGGNSLQKMGIKMWKMPPSRWNGASMRAEKRILRLSLCSYEILGKGCRLLSSLDPSKAFVANGTLKVGAGITQNWYRYIAVQETPTQTPHQLWFWLVSFTARSKILKMPLLNGVCIAREKFFHCRISFNGTKFQTS